MKQLALGLLLPLLLAACAPPQGMVATLTFLPGTPTPFRTRIPTPTPRFTPTLEIEPEETLYSPANCPAGTYASAPPEDPSRMIGLSYNPSSLPAAFELIDQEPMDNNRHRLITVRWQGRSLYWIDKLVCRNVAGKAHWVVTDVLALPRLDPSAYEAETRACFTGNEPLPDAIAYGVFDPSAPAQTLPGSDSGVQSGQPLEIYSAWEAGRSFTSLDPTSIRCFVIHSEE